MAKEGMAAETERSRKMRRLFARWERSGLTLSEFARREDLVPATLYWWRRRLREAEGAAPAAVSFTEVSGVVVVAAAGGRGFEVVLDGGTTVRVPEQFDAAALRRLLDTLREC
jgi:transposase-like protein